MEVDVLPRTRAEAIAADLRDRILAGHYSPGQHLRQSAIADIYGVSTTPVREAFSVLAREGLVVKDAHRGVEVFRPSVEELHENFELRRELEPMAARFASKELRGDELSELSDLVEEMRDAKVADYPPLNQEFHRRIYLGARRKRLLDLIMTLREAAASYTSMTVRLYDPDYHRQVQEEHEEILRALNARSGQRAARLVRVHLDNNQRHQAALLESQ